MESTADTVPMLVPAVSVPMSSEAETLPIDRPAVADTVLADRSPTVQPA